MRPTNQQTDEQLAQSIEITGDSFSEAIQTVMPAVPKSSKSTKWTFAQVSTSYNVHRSQQELVVAGGDDQVIVQAAVACTAIQPGTEWSCLVSANALKDHTKVLKGLIRVTAHMKAPGIVGTLELDSDRTKFTMQTSSPTAWGSIQERFSSSDEDARTVMTVSAREWKKALKYTMFCVPAQYRRGAPPGLILSNSQNGNGTLSFTGVDGIRLAQYEIEHGTNDHEWKEILPTRAMTVVESHLHGSGAGTHGVTIMRCGGVTASGKPTGRRMLIWPSPMVAIQAVPLELSGGKLPDYDRVINQPRPSTLKCDPKLLLNALNALKSCHARGESRIVFDISETVLKLSSDSVVGVSSGSSTVQCSYSTEDGDRKKVRLAMNVDSLIDALRRYDERDENGARKNVTMHLGPSDKAATMPISVEIGSTFIVMPQRAPGAGG